MILQHSTRHTHPHIPHSLFSLSHTQFSRGDAVAVFGSFAIIGKIVSALYLYRFLINDLGGSLSMFPLPSSGTTDEQNNNGSGGGGGGGGGGKSEPAAVFIPQEPSYSGSYQDSSYQAS